MTAPSIKEALELKPCPFCGSQPSFESSDTGCVIKCVDDGCWLNQAEVFEWSDDEAVRCWNTRATLSQPTADRREIVARVVDPEAFQNGLRKDGVSVYWFERRSAALAKADSILSALDDGGADA